MPNGRRLDQFWLVCVGYIVRYMPYFMVDTVQKFPSLEDFCVWCFKMFQVCHNFEANVAMNMFNWAQARRDVSKLSREKLSKLDATVER